MIRWLAAVTILLSLSSALHPALADDASAGLTKAQVEVIVRDYLAQHPEVVVNALRAYQQQQAMQKQAAAQQALKDHTKQIYDDPRSPFAGPADAKVVIVEFFDYRCPYCRHSAPDLAALLKHDSDVKLIYKDFPILGPASVLASRAALAARKQGLYQPFHDALMKADIDFSEASIMKVAASVGINTAKLKADMADPAINTYLADNEALATTLGINGTPTFIIDGRLIASALDRKDLDQLVAAARQG